MTDKILIYETKKSNWLTQVSARAIRYQIYQINKTR